MSYRLYECESSESHKSLLILYREEVSEATSDVEDGSFLLRNATSHPTHGDYTLVLR